MAPKRPRASPKKNAPSGKIFAITLWDSSKGDDSNKYAWDPLKDEFWCVEEGNVRRVEEQELTGDTAIILEMRFDATYLVSLESMRKKSYGWFVDCFFWLDPNVYSTRPAQVDLFLEDAVVRARYADLSAEKSKGKAGASTSKGKAGASTSKGKASDVPPLQDWLLLQADSKAASDLQDRFIHGLCVVDAEAEEAMDLQLKDVLPSGEFYDDFEKFKEAIEEDRE